MTPSLSLTADPIPLAAPDARDRRDQHCQQLRACLAANPKNETAWYDLSLAANDPAERLECLVRLVEIRTADSTLPGGQVKTAARLRAVAAQVERQPRGPISRIMRSVGQALTVALLVLLALVVGPMALGARTVIILSGSMRPVIQPGSAVIARPVPAQSLKVGDVIVFAPDANAVIPKVHRIIGIREEDGLRYFTTRGDANGSDDPGEVSLNATGWHVWYSVPLVGYAVAWATSKAGMVTLIAVPLLALVGLGLMDWWKHNSSRRPARLVPHARPAWLRVSVPRLLLAQLRPPTLPSWLRLSVVRELPPLFKRIRMPARLRLFAQPVLRELQALPELLVLLRLRLLPVRLRMSSQSTLLRQSYLRALRELHQLRALLRLPPRSALRELSKLLRLSVKCELRAFLRLPAVIHLRARLHPL